MKRKILHIAFAALAALSIMGCTDADKELYRVDLAQQLRPTGLRTTFIGAESVTLAWTGHSSSYTVEYSVSSDFDVDVESVTQLSEPSCTVGDLLEGTYYYFRVKGISPNGSVESSEFGQALSVRTLTTPPIPNIQASATMTYTDTPEWSVTHTIALSWGMPDVELEQVSSVTLTPAGNPAGALTYPVTTSERNAQAKTIKRDLAGSTTYTATLYVGTKARGTCQVTTKADPIPTLTAWADLDFDTTPESAMFNLTWELYYVDPANIASVRVTKQGESTPFKSQDITPSDRTAEGTLVKGLATGTTYLVELIHTDATVIASMTASTPGRLPAGTIVVNTTDNLAAAISAAGRTAEMVYLMSGTHTLTTTDAAVLISSGLVLTSADPAHTTVRMAKPFSCYSTVAKIEFSNITFITSGYFFQQTAGASNNYNIELVKWDNCVIGVDPTGSTASRSLMVTGWVSGMTKARVGTLWLHNSKLYSNTAVSYGVLYHSTANTAGFQCEVNNFKVTGSTISGVSRLIDWRTVANLPYTFTMENSTLYSLMNTAAATVVSTSGNPGAGTYNISNSIWHMASAGVLLNLNRNASYSGTISGFYVIQGGAATFTNTPQAIQESITLLNTAARATDIFLSPGIDPTAPGTSFQIKQNIYVPLTVGDPRWN